MTIGCQDPKQKFKPCADCSFEYQPKGCRENKQKMGYKTVYMSPKWNENS